MPLRIYTLTHCRRYYMSGCIRCTETVDNWCLMTHRSVVCSGMTAIATYLLTKEIWNSGAGLFAACFIAVGQLIHSNVCNIVYYSLWESRLYLHSSYFNNIQDVAYSATFMQLIQGCKRDLFFRDRDVWKFVWDETFPDFPETETRPRPSVLASRRDRDVFRDVANDTAC